MGGKRATRPTASGLVGGVMSGTRRSSHFPIRERLQNPLLVFSVLCVLGLLCGLHDEFCGWPFTSPHRHVGRVLKKTSDQLTRREE